jgi:hypothetical protein
MDSSSMRRRCAASACPTNSPEMTSGSMFSAREEARMRVGFTSDPRARPALSQAATQVDGAGEEEGGV